MPIANNEVYLTFESIVRNMHVCNTDTISDELQNGEINIIVTTGQSVKSASLISAFGHKMSLYLSLPPPVPANSKPRYKHHLKR